MKYLLLLMTGMLVCSVLNSQDRFGLGFSAGPDVCFTDLTPRLTGDHRTIPEFSDVFNFSTGFAIDYGLESGIGFHLGTTFSRKRFGFVHSGEVNGSPLHLWGHSEYHTFSVPMQFSFIVYTHSDPYFTIAPFAGGFAGINLVSYRNITRLDENYLGYQIELFQHDNRKLTAGAELGVNMRTVVDQLGMLQWGISFSREMTPLQPFRYDIESLDGANPFEQELTMNMVSLTVTYFFRTWEIFEGRMMRRRLD